MGIIWDTVPVVSLPIFVTIRDDVLTNFLYRIYESNLCRYIICMDVCNYVYIERWQETIIYPQQIDPIIR